LKKLKGLWGGVKVAGKAETSILRRNETQRVLRAMAEGRLAAAEPTIDFDGGVLLSEAIVSLAVCLKCGSHKLMLQLSCPACGSARVEKAPMIEHMNCGHVDEEERFRSDGELKCPKCGKTLGGTLTVCLACGGKFPALMKRYTCSRLHIFEEAEAVIRRVKAYRLNTAKKSFVESEIMDFQSILKRVAGKGWLFQAPAVLKERNGVARA